ncbi:MAG: mechanosensitive ion channel family protein [Alicyclobacillaceae bacterium]|nr:mechanosensitive ion channel family protein [Alicyclobacillaceae bacterium]
MSETPTTPAFPWRRVFVSFAVLILFAISLQSASELINSRLIPAPYQNLFATGAAVVWVIAGLILVNRMRHALMRLVFRTPRHASLWNLGINVLTGIGYLFVVIFSLRMLNTSMSSLLVSGAVTGVVVGIAAQSTLSNLLAGLVIMTLRPFSLGQRITCRSWMFGGVEYSGLVTELNLFYTILQDGEILRVIPNSAAVIATITVHSAEAESATYTVALPYECPAEQVEAKLRELAGPEASAWVETFDKEAVQYRVRVPVSRVDALRRLVLWAKDAGETAVAKTGEEPNPS